MDAANQGNEGRKRQRRKARRLSEAEFEKIAHLSFTNAKQLNEEAHLLFDAGRYARATALAIYSIEEQTKAITMLSASIGRIKPEELESGDKGQVDFLRHHKGKHLVFGVAMAVSLGIQDSFQRMLRGENPTPESIDGEAEAKMKETIALFGNLNRVRLESIYVEPDGPAVLPSDVFTKERSATLLEFATRMISLWRVAFENPKEVWLPWLDAFMTVWGSSPPKK